MNEDRKRPEISVDPPVTLMIGDEITPMPTEEAFSRFVDEILKPRYAFERTVEGHRLTRKIDRK